MLLLLATCVGPASSLCGDNREESSLLGYMEAFLQGAFLKGAKVSSTSCEMCSTEEMLEYTKTSLRMKIFCTSECHTLVSCY